MNFTGHLLRLVEQGACIMESVSVPVGILPSVPPATVCLALGAIAAPVAAAVYFLRKCCKDHHSECESDILASIHYYSGEAPEKNCSQKCIDLMKRYPHLVNQPIPCDQYLSHGYTPFLRACWNNNFELIKYMLSCGADIRRTNSDGEGALYLVAYRVSKSLDKWDPRALNLLWEVGCSVDDVNVLNNSLMHLAAKEGNATLTRWLLLHGAETNVSNNFGYTPRALAIHKGTPSHKIVAELLAPVRRSYRRTFERADGGVHVLERSNTEPLDDSNGHDVRS